MKLSTSWMVVWFCCVYFLSFSMANAEGEGMHKGARQYIEEFRRGISFNPNDGLDGVVSHGRVDPAVLFLLSKELAGGTPHVRENIVMLLEKMGLVLDAPGPEKFAIIRDHSIIRILLIQGFAKDDAAANLAAGILRDRSAPSDLAPFHDIFLKSLKQSSGDYLYLLAKAKTNQARPYVEKLATSEAWQRNADALRVLRIAQAALGNSAVEDEFIEAVGKAEKEAPPAPTNRFYDVGEARDGKILAERIRLLGFIGTKRSLAVVCTYLRSPIKTYVPNIKERSIRYDALDAIRYNYPDERLLYRPTELPEWIAAENFCTRHIGVIFDGSTPELPPDRPYPTGLRR